MPPLSFMLQLSFTFGLWPCGKDKLNFSSMSGFSVEALIILIVCQFSPYVRIGEWLMLHQSSHLMTQIRPKAQSIAWNVMWLNQTWHGSNPSSWTDLAHATCGNDKSVGHPSPRVRRRGLWVWTAPHVPQVPEHACRIVSLTFSEPGRVNYLQVISSEKEKKI